MSPLADIAAGVLAASLFIGGAGLGAAVLRLIGVLVGGSWSGAPLLERLASFAPLLLILAFAARAALTLVMSGAGYDGAGWIVMRLAVVCVLWVGLAWMATGRPSKLASALALTAFGISLPLMGYDLIDSLEPGWVSSGEAYAVGVRMMGAALAATLLLAPPEGKDRRDLQGLLAATLLATLYLNLMSYLVPWYGDLPDKIGWIVLRRAWPWAALIWTALGLGALLPLPLMALQRRLGHTAAKAAAALALTGFFAQTLWLVTPPFGPLGALAALAMTLVVGSAFWLAVAPWRRPAHG